MTHRRLALALVLFVGFASSASAFWFGKGAAPGTGIKGTLIDWTANHGKDQRIWSPALGMKRDLYVYLPPGYTPCKRYPVMIWLHGMDQDEQSFVFLMMPFFERLILEGRLPPMVIAAPDGSLTGTPKLIGGASFFLNTPRGGRFEDYLVQDVWGLLNQQFSLRPEAGAHIISGFSMGGFTAFNKVLKYPDTFGVALAIFPPLHTRYMDCHGNTNANFDPSCHALREDFTDSRTIIGRFLHVIKIRQGPVMDPLYDLADPRTTALIAADNPYEQLDAERHGNGKVALYVGYGGRDQFNLDAHAEAFQHRARQLGIPLTTERLRCGDHLPLTAIRLLPGAFAWLNNQVAAYRP